jgi:hypothetical protein
MKFSFGVVKMISLPAMDGSGVSLREVPSMMSAIPL